MTAKARPKIIVLGSMCRLPVAGVVYQLLHYMLGFERLGFEVYYVEWHGNWVEDPMASTAAELQRRVCISDVMQRHGFGDRWICRADQVAPGHTYGGLPYERLVTVCKEAEAVMNVTGAHFMDEIFQACGCRVYLESDPGIPQIKWSRGDPKTRALIAGHTHLFTFAENIHGDDCLLPADALAYHTTRQPVLLDQWENAATSRRGYTTVARWKKQREKAIEFEGERYRWNKDEEFENYIDLPQRSGRQMELALAEVGRDSKQRLEAHDWNVIDAVQVSASLERYRSYIRNSRGEFTVAKDQYVRLRTGWFSDRSACYLAAGRPVVTQDTGLAGVLPTGEGLFAYRTLNDVLEAFDSIDVDYDRHSRAAGELAREYFDADRVLRDILEAIDLECPH